MDGKKIEVECPVCDHMVASDAKRCPSCGADFTVSGVEDLEMVARDLNDQGKAQGPDAGRTSEAADDKKEGLLGRLFKKKR